MSAPALAFSAAEVEGQVPLPGVLPVEGLVLAHGDLDTERCTEPECGEEFTALPGAKQSAAMLLGKHRWSVHRIRRDGTRAEPAKAAKAAKAGADPSYVEARPVAGTIAAAGAVVKGSGPPRAEQLATAFGIGLSEVTKGAAKLALRADPIQQRAQVESPATAATREEHLTAALSLTRETAAKVMAPVARIFAGTELNKRIGRQLVENTDLAPAITELAEFGHAWLTYIGTMRGIRRDLAAIRAQQAEQQQPGGYLPAPSPVPPVADVAPAGALDPQLGGGRIATATHPIPQT